MPALVSIVKEQSGSWASLPVRLMAIDLLKDIGPAAAKAVPDLGDTLKDPDPTVSGHAADALAAIVPNDPRTISSLIGLLQGPNALSGVKRCPNADRRHSPRLRGLSHFSRTKIPKSAGTP